MKVLFVIDEASSMRATKNMLDESNLTFEYEFASSGTEALSKFETQEFQAVVSDLTMPGMNGPEFLNAVFNLNPETIRVIAAGKFEKRAAMKEAKQMEQFLPKPYGLGELALAFQKARLSRNVLQSDSLAELVARIPSLPMLPEIYRELNAELDSPGSSAETVGEIISRDPAMTAKILHVANSSMFGLQHSVTSASRAATMLGLETISALTLAIGVFRPQEGQARTGFSIDGLLHHSMKVAVDAQRLCIQAGLSHDLAEEAFTAGILHDIGKLVLLSVDPAEFEMACLRAVNEGISLREAEISIFGLSHADIGAFLASRWGLPQSLVEVIAFHHEPWWHETKSFSTLSAVYFANLLGKNDATIDDPCLTQYAEQIGCADKLEGWLESCQNCANGELQTTS